MSTPGDELGPVLDRLSGTDLYRNNAFRITGLPPDASPSRIRRAREEALLVTRLTSGAGTGRMRTGPPSGNGMGGPSPALPAPRGPEDSGAAPEAEAVRAAYEVLRDPVARLIHELLWTWTPESGAAPPTPTPAPAHPEAPKAPPATTGPDRPDSGSPTAPHRPATAPATARPGAPGAGNPATAAPATAGPATARPDRPASSDLAAPGPGTTRPGAAPASGALTPAQPAAGQPAVPGGGVGAAHDRAVRLHREVLEAAAAGDPVAGSAEAWRRDEAWERALAAWAGVLAEHGFWDRAKHRVADIGDPRLTTGTVRRLRERLPRHIVAVTAELALRAARAEPAAHEEPPRRRGAPLAGPRAPEPAPRRPAAQQLVALLHASPFPPEVVADALREAVRPAERAIRTACSAAHDTIHAAEAEGGRAGRELVERTAEPLRVVAALDGADGTLTTALSQETAVRLNQCAVAHFHANKTARTAMDLMLAAQRLARDSDTLNMIAENIDIVSRSDSAVPSGPGNELPHFLRELCRKGKVERVAGYLRAMAAVQVDRRIRKRLLELSHDRRTVAAPVHREPFLGSLLGCGVRPYRTAGPDADGTLWVTYTLTLLYVPLLALGLYAMDDRGVHARLPVGTRARWARRGLFAVLLTAVVGLVAGLPTAAGFAGVFTIVQLYYRGQVRRARVRAWARWESAR